MSIFKKSLNNAKIRVMAKSIKTEPKEDLQIDVVLRPSCWNDYIGQDRVKNNIQIIIEAAKKRKGLPDHLLFYGQHGLGKTTLANLIAKEMTANLRVVSGVSLEKSGDLVAVLANLEKGDVLFIDEAHRLNRMIEEILYPAMESRKMYITVGKGPAAKMLSIDLPPFTLIAATTRVNLLSAPLRSRFGAIFNLEYYELKEVEKIIMRSAQILGLKLNDEAIAMVARASRFTPRTANRLLKRIRDFAEVNNHKIITAEVVMETFKMLDIDEIGLEKSDRKLLEIIIKKFQGGPVGLNTLSAVLGEDRGIIEEVHEPFLLKTGLLIKASHGRVATNDAYKHLNLEKYQVE
ncbi:Holliday junction branch migration DNA helicase RuvB [Candidatus Wolfebacteria bacterium CG10_big_fil_rev_8_21_14_0_10_31_9]|uniref:Holliday junction branch migration complex subunit RuvB n=1 Tax=Candidatus Wolfebacteria bacterium CG10_big_fil_rev_8_21_14_0_10_31_9 TaxID=1975070 RepID=A0A2H0REX7_9BACT|nr:MAG: Holliday junction branch migration DNA helicase RuvB [Candidatus Wolfebacteria bacterium CG10_big_fil_rev_8_21_14_0_10_31_9]